MTESPKSPPRLAPRPAGGLDSAAAPLPAASSQGPARSGVSKSHGPPPPPIRDLPPTAAASAVGQPLTRAPARDTLAPSSFGVLAGPKSSPAPNSSPLRAARAPLPTLGDLEGATATATLRPPGAVPPPPRALPTATPSLDATGLDRSSPLESPPVGGDQPFLALAGALPPSPMTPRTRAEPVPTPREHAAIVSGHAAPSRDSRAVDASLTSTLDTRGTPSNETAQATLVEPTRISGGAAPTAASALSGSAVPAPGLFIADEPVERRPSPPSLVTEQLELLTRLRVAVMVLGGLLLMAAGALVVMVMRRADANAARTATSARSVSTIPACTLLAPPSRISPIERSVPISAVPQADGSVALAIADTKSSAAGWLYDPSSGEAKRKLDAPAGSGDVSHVSASEPLLVDHASADFAFAQTLAPGLTLGVGPAGIMRRGDDGATGVAWPLSAGSRVTPPRVVSTAKNHFVAFRQGGAEGQIATLWLDESGVAAGPAVTVTGAPKNLGTPNVALIGARGLVLFSARADKSEPYRIYAALAAPGQAPSPVQILDLPVEGGGAIAPSLATLSNDRYLVQWTDGNVGQYQVHVRLLDRALHPLSQALLVSGKGANAGQGTIVATSRASVSFYIQTTAGHDELWGATLSCR